MFLNIEYVEVQLVGFGHQIESEQIWSSERFQFPTIIQCVSSTGSYCTTHATELQPHSNAYTNTDSANTCTSTNAQSIAYSNAESNTMHGLR